ncbi:MAG TPA: hypothetical protein DCE02_04740 [Ruminiclostridium sp.]|uniref:Uncharacterized protein n=1 Tax=Acetivibrio saccincola TaxID=1677857 RepID=A0A2S8RC68_9FIRM|nr:hypothetical protein [Acetivibrio saccincola]PQQ67396.1 hypothetical protein B9R14_11985 [Acetivibrio saccincola]HAA43294.1 hypothetical protein [Ruminiclostridium sp.]
MSEFLFDIFENIVDVIDTVVDEVQKKSDKNKYSQRTAEGNIETIKGLSHSARRPVNVKENVIISNYTNTDDKSGALREANSGTVKENVATPKIKEHANPSVKKNRNSDIIPNFSNLSGNDVLKGLIFSEILGKPKSLRRYRQYL